MAEIFNITFLSHMKILIVAILIYAIIYSLLRKLEIFGEKKEVSAVIAFVSAIIVSFSGVVTYAVTYAINWFVIIIFIIFLLLMILMFLGMKFDDITPTVKKNSKFIVIAFFILFSIIILKSFFALNNTFDTSNPVEDNYTIDTSFNTGFDDITNEDNTFFESLFSMIDRDVLGAVLFLMVLGVFVFFLGK